jgi:signal transduction histidine kinase
MKIRFNQLSIYQRILATILLIVLIFGSTVGFVVWDSMNMLVSDHLTKQGVEIATHLALIGSNVILMDDFYQLHELVLQTQASSEDIRYILVFDAGKRLLAHSFHGGIPLGILSFDSVAMPTVYQVKLFSSNEGQIHDIIVPIENGAVGFVRIGMTEAFVRKSLLHHIGNISIVFLLVCALAVFLSSAIAKKITRPIDELVQTAEAITQGNLAVRSSVIDQGEMGKLAKAFDEMTVSLIGAAKEKGLLLSELIEKEQLRNHLFQKLITAQEDERKRISRELHDQTSQALTSLMLTMRILAEDATTESQKEALRIGRDVAASLLKDVREMAIDLRPPVLDDLGLVPAIKKYIDQFGNRHRLCIDFTGNDTGPSIEGSISVALYRVLQEALNNVVKHAGANTVRIAFSNETDFISLKISDDGCGISDEDLFRAKQNNRIGLFGMRERVELLFGSFEILTSAEGGAELSITVPHQSRERGPLFESENDNFAGG